MTSCPEETRLIRMVASELAEAESLALQAHLNDCESCRAKARQLEATWNLLGYPPVALPDSDLTGRVMAAVSIPQSAKWTGRWGRLAATIALAAGLGAGAGWLTPSGGRIQAEAAVSEDELIESLGLRNLSGESGGLAGLFDDEGTVTEPAQGEDS